MKTLPSYLLMVFFLLGLILMAGCNREDPMAPMETETYGGELSLQKPNALFGKNLIVNGDAEAGESSQNPPYEIVPIPGWTSTDETVVCYCMGAQYFPTYESPGPANRGDNFFTGGPDIVEATAQQTVDVSSAAMDIDKNRVMFILSGYLGGWNEQEDNATVTANFKDGGGNTLVIASIGPVTRDDRNGVTGLFFRTTSGNVPVGTRTVDIVLTSIRTQGYDNDGYADNLSLVLIGSESVTGSGHITRFNDDTEGWRNFTLSAKKGTDGTVTGRFEVVNRLFDPQARASGSITCFSIADDGKTVRMGGIIEKSNIAEIVGTWRIWIVRDNGEGRGAPPDEISVGLEWVESEAAAMAFCASDEERELRPIEAGNIQVHQ